MERGRPVENYGKNRKSGSTILYLTLTPVQQGTRRKSTIFPQTLSAVSKSSRSFVFSHWVRQNLLDTFRKTFLPTMPCKQLTFILQCMSNLNVHEDTVRNEDARNVVGWCTSQTNTRSWRLLALTRGHGACSH